MYQQQLAREAQLIARGYQEYAAYFAGRWQAVLRWAGLEG